MQRRIHAELQRSVDATERHSRAQLAELARDDGVFEADRCVGDSDGTALARIDAASLLHEPYVETRALKRARAAAAHGKKVAHRDNVEQLQGAVRRLVKSAEALVAEATRRETQLHAQHLALVLCQRRVESFGADLLERYYELMHVVAPPFVGDFLVPGVDHIPSAAARVAPCTDDGDAPPPPPPHAFVTIVGDALAPQHIVSVEEKTRAAAARKDAAAARAALKRARA